MCSQEEQETPEDILGNFQQELLKDSHKEVLENSSGGFPQCPMRFSRKNSWKVTIRNTTVESYPEGTFGEVPEDTLGRKNPRRSFKKVTIRNTR